MPKLFLKSCAAILLSLSLLGNSQAAVNFDGVDDSVVIEDRVILDFSSPTQRLAISALIYPTNVTGRRSIVSRYTLETNKEFFFEVNNGYLQCRAYENLVDADYTSLRRQTDEAVISINTWYYVTCVIDIANDDINFYVNGTQVADSAIAGSVAVTTIPNSTANIYIGRTGSAVDFWFAGIISEVSIYASTSAQLNVGDYANLALSKLKGMPSQITTISNVAYLPLDDQPAGTSADGDTARDMSGNGNNGTGSDGANNTGLTWSEETILSYPPHPIGTQ